MTDLVGFLRARLDEDEQIARDGAMRRGPDWFLREEPPPAWGDNWPDPEIIAGGKPIVCCDEEQGGHLVAEHIARHDPARVLAEVAAKRQLVELHEGSHECSTYDHNGDIDTCTWVTDDCSTLQVLALPYADHPDYQQEWNP